LRGAESSSPSYARPGPAFGCGSSARSSPSPRALYFILAARFKAYKTLFQTPAHFARHQHIFWILVGGFGAHDTADERFVCVAIGSLLFFILKHFGRVYFLKIFLIRQLFFDKELMILQL